MQEVCPHRLCSTVLCRGPRERLMQAGDRAHPWWSGLEDGRAKAGVGKGRHTLSPQGTEKTPCGQRKGSLLPQGGVWPIRHTSEVQTREPACV